MSVTPRKFYQVLVVFKDISCDKDWNPNGTHYDSNQGFDDEFMDE